MENESTIKDFGNQWARHGDLDEDYWTSEKLFLDHFPFGEPVQHYIQGKIVVEVGSGSGRILKMLSRFKPSKLIGVEPSSGFPILSRNTIHIPNLTLLNTSAEEFSIPGGVDLIVSLGVIHHISKPEAAVRNIWSNLKPGGTFIMWVYGFENQKSYVIFQKLFRPLFRLLPDFVLDIFSFAITFVLDFYLFMSLKFFRSKLPLTGYLSKLFSKCGRKQKKYIVFDQLNPAHAKYYKKREVVSLLEDSGFKVELLYHRHGYSWTAIAQRMEIEHSAL
jgi:SAM-dependent methyltransferase